MVTARLQRVARDDQKGVQSWVGTFDDAPGSLLVLSKAKGVVTGYANYKDQTLELLPAAGGNHVLFAVDTARQPKTDRSTTTSAKRPTLMAASADYGTGGATTWRAASAGAVVHDVLILYTAASASTCGQGTLESMVQSAVQAANQAYVNSQANVTMNVVGLQQSASPKAAAWARTLDALKNNTTVRSLRDRLAADMVVLVSENTDYCGYATLWYSYNGASTNWDAYAAVNSGCLSNQTLAHEVGHMQQLDHNRENAIGIGRLRLLVWLSPVLERRFRRHHVVPVLDGRAEDQLLLQPEHHLQRLCDRDQLRSEPGELCRDRADAEQHRSAGR